MNDDIQALKEAEKQQEQQQTPPQQASKRAPRQRDSNWLVGGVLILLGILFLIGNYTTFQLQNWWAIFILIPALCNLGTAWNAYRAKGHLSHRGRNALTWGLVTLTVAIIFLLNLNWGIVWPIFLIVIGLGSLVSFFSRPNPA